MVERPERRRSRDRPPGDPEPEWEVFVRSEETAPLRHVGSVSAPTVEVAYEQATRLFAWYAEALWLCAATDMHRFTTHELDDEARAVQVTTGEERRTREP
jgi:rSAM-partnered protein